MCLYKFTHIPLLKSDALLKNNNKKRPKKQSPKFIRKKIISRKKKKKSCPKKTQKQKITKEEEEKKKEKGNRLDKPMCKCTSAFSSFTYYIHSTQFSLHFGENILVGLGRKQLGSTNFFSSPHSNQTLTKKIFFPIFSLMFSIYLILPPNKHTLRAGLVGGVEKWEG